MYVGVNGVAKGIKKAYVGINGLAKEVKKAYVGVNGVAHLFWTSGYLYNGVSTFVFDGSNFNIDTSLYTLSADYFSLTVLRYDTFPLNVYIDGVLVSTITDESIEKNADTGEQVFTLNGETAKLLKKADRICIVTIESEGVYSIGHLGFYSYYTPKSKGTTATFWANISSLLLSDNINGILDSAFTEFTGTSITIPSSVASIGARAFAGCTTLTDITFTHWNSNPLFIAYDETTVSECAFYVSADVPTNIYHKGHDSVLNYAWASCLRTVTFLEA